MSDLKEPGRITKAVTVNPQRAEALADGLQQIITHPCRPNGDERTAAEQAQVGVSIGGLERFAIHSGGPGGVLIATAVLAGVVPINSSPRGADGKSVKWRTMVEPRDGRLLRWDWDDDPYVTGPLEPGWWISNISHELDHGTFRYGWWAWMLDDIRRLPTPIECSGHPGVWMIPDDIAAQLAKQPA